VWWRAGAKTRGCFVKLRHSEREAPPESSGRRFGLGGSPGAVEARTAGSSSAPRHDKQAGQGLVAILLALIARAWGVMTGPAAPTTTVTELPM
jgi:hypothetical protein